MRLNQWIPTLAAGMLVALTPVLAQPVKMMEQVQVPRCLADQLPTDYAVLAENRNFKIINVPSEAFNQLTLKAEAVRCGHFKNVSRLLKAVTAAEAKALLDKPTLTQKRLVAERYEIRHQQAVESALAMVEPQNIWDTLTHLTNFENRSATKQTGVDAANWLKSQFDSLATASGRDDTHSYMVGTGRYKQPSLVTVIGKDLKAPAVVIGAHMDTLDGRMPGAGDDGSGSSSVMEMTRVLLASEQHFNRPIYIIWYAAEERGLVGSQYVVQDFLDKNIPVKAAIQFDMTGYRNDPNDRSIWVYRDYTDKTLSDFVVKLIQNYINVPVRFSRCGYGCSDHASWMEEGIPAAFPCETSFEDHNPYIHTQSDTMSLISLDHMTNFTKLALAFAIELAAE